jgi:hypothetical protein
VATHESGPFLWGEVACGDGARVLLPGGERHRPGEAVAAVIDDEQSSAPGSNAIIDVAAGSVLSAVPSCCSVDVDHSLTMPSPAAVVANRCPVESNAMLVTGSEDTITGVVA